MPKNRKKLITVVIPLYNEEETIPELYRRLRAVFDKVHDNYEIICIDDGSNDKTLRLLVSLRRTDRHVKILSFSRNFGHQAAISAGIEHASGNAVIIMDGDLQDPPEILPQFIQQWKEGYDVVYAIRRKRKENIFKRTVYAAFYRLLTTISYLKIPLDSGDFCIMDQRVVQLLRRLPERHRFVRGLRTWTGFQQTGLAYERDRRFAGKPKYTLGKLLKLAYDGIFSFSTVPLRIAIYSGIIVALLSFAGGLWVIYEKIVGGIPIAGWASTIVTMVFLSGIILFTLGIVGEYIGRIYDEVKQRPLYVIKEKIGL
jgi:glycosyltransferase involved in cell wall biosynthesis